MPGAAHRFLPCAQTRLARRTHADSRRRIADREETLRRSCLPERVRQNEFRDVDSAETFRWMESRDGRLWAVNPENGYFGVVPGTSCKSNPNAMKSIERDTLYTNVALTDDGDVWWEGKDGAPPKHAFDWRGNDWTPDSKEKAAHPNSRFATPMRNNPVLDPHVERGEGVPISAIII